MHSRASDRGSASKCQGKWPDQILDQAFGLPEVLVAVSTSRLSCKRAGKTRTLMRVWELQQVFLSGEYDCAAFERGCSDCYRIDAPATATSVRAEGIRVIQLQTAAGFRQPTNHRVPRAGMGAQAFDARRLTTATSLMALTDRRRVGFTDVWPA
jgi:hypothetical protein